MVEVLGQSKFQDRGGMWHLTSPLSIQRSNECQSGEDPIALVLKRFEGIKL